ncbi:hypothetical protein, variant 2 [Aphanomyces astaci]|nr:hypothetical protein, variant 2 [Aphanomyces astaci]ETV77427.1 hypothetical protein, variant 2 [Aphanomyces astaci]|eukprot:XP_009833214.1 hypothetical protein, variant 2 [Aphanomyces astaci]
MLPSLTQVFGTSKPHPKDYDESRPAASSLGVPLPKHPILGPSSASRRATSAGPKVVWAKQAGMGVIERDVQIVEHVAPPRPSTDFSTANAVLIEGYVFPAHKGNRASKLAKRLAAASSTSTSTTTPDPLDEEEVFTSDDDDTSSGGDSSAAEESSEDSEGNVDTFSAADLSPFASLWWKVSEMVTPATIQLVARFNGQSNVEYVAAPVTSSTDLDNRRLLFGTFCTRQLPFVVQACHALRSDRGVQMNMSDVVQTLHLRQPIEGTRVCEWNAMCLLLLLVVHGRTPTTWHNAIAPTSLKHLTGLEVCEMDQLIGVFCETMHAYVLADQLDGPAASTKAIPSATTAAAAGRTQCRKCRHRTCQCKAKAGDANRSEFSDAEIAAMMKESLKIQEMAEFGALD